MTKHKKKEIFHYSKTPFAELHLHFGGAITPRILWHKVQADHKAEHGMSEPDQPIGEFKNFKEFQAYFDNEKENLDDYLLMHKLVEPLQSFKRMDYFIHRLMRGAFAFENLSYLEIRHCPYGRTSKDKPEAERIHEMRDIVIEMDRAMQFYSSDKAPHTYPIIMKQILCLHAQYSHNVNRAILDLAKEMRLAGKVCGIDIAGGETFYSGSDSSKLGYKNIIDFFEEAKDAKLGTTAHIFETTATPVEMEGIFQFLDRIGHGIMIPLQHKSLLKKLNKYNICLEVCPSTYAKYKTFSGYEDKRLKEVFDICDQHNIDIVVGTDNSGMHGTRLQIEFENLLIHEVIKYEQLDRYRHNAFKHAFGLTKLQRKIFTKDPSIRIDLPNFTLDVKI